MKRCSTCGEIYLIEAFSKNGHGHRAKCKSCVATYAKRRHELARAFLQGMKDVPCTDCGIEYPPHVMDFDHLPQYEKLFTIGEKTSASLRRLATEISKCEVVCANCHRERSFQRSSSSDTVQLETAAIEQTSLPIGQPNYGPERRKSFPMRYKGGTS